MPFSGLLGGMMGRPPPGMVPQGQPPMPGGMINPAQFQQMQQRPMVDPRRQQLAQMLMQAQTPERGYNAPRITGGRGGSGHGAGGGMGGGWGGR